MIGDDRTIWSKEEMSNFQKQINKCSSNGSPAVKNTTPQIIFDQNIIFCKSYEIFGSWNITKKQNQHYQSSYGLLIGVVYHESSQICNSTIKPLHLDILIFRAKTMPQIKGKRQGVPNWYPLNGNRVKDI